MNSAEVRKHRGRTKQFVNKLKVYRLPEESNFIRNFLNNRFKRPTIPKYIILCIWLDKIVDYAQHSLKSLSSWSPGSSPGTATNYNTTCSIKLVVKSHRLDQAAM